MKHILQAFDSATSTKVEGVTDMKQFLFIVSESDIVEDQSNTQYNIVEDQSITPFMNEYILPDVFKPKSTISKYIKLVENERSICDTKKKTQISEKAKRIAEKVQDIPDTITVDVPLMIRLLEYAKEDAKDDMDLHRISENLIRLSKKNNILSMKSYNSIIGKK